MNDVSRSKRMQICALITEWILEERAGLVQESYAPTRDADASDDKLQRAREVVEKLRGVRQEIEELD